MASEPQTESRSGSGDEPSWSDRLLWSPLLWGGAATVALYAALPYVPVYRELLQRYLCGHPLEYATATLFFVGMAILGSRWLRLSSEKAALSESLLDDLALNQQSGPLERAELLRAKLRTLPLRIRQSCLGQRIKDVCAYVQARNTSGGLESHLQYLTQQAADRAHESYGFVRTISWAIPIIGFLGTVMGITVAIANITPEQLDSSIGAVTAGLALAFDTTALSLTLSLVIVFAYFVVERAEQGILSRVEDFGTRRILPVFPAEAAVAGNPIADVQSEAARKLLEQTESLINWQTELWQESLESMRERWSDTLNQQQQAFDAALQQGMAATLSDHAGQLQSVRGEFLQAFRDASQQLTEGLAEAQHGLVQGLSEHVGGWQEQLERSTDAAGSQLDELRRQGEILLQIVGQEEQLVRLQGRLAENLETLRATETFEEALHSLSAAVHLLTARAGSKLNAA